MTTIFFLRHATTAPHLGKDADRVLSPYGEQESESVGRYLKALPDEEKPQGILASPVKRIKQTIAGMERGGFRCGVTTDPALYNASVEALETVPQDYLLLHPDITRLLVVSHNPGLQWLAGNLSFGKIHNYPPATLMRCMLEAGRFQLMDVIEVN